MINPFARPVVDDPRDLSATVESINKAALLKMLHRFEELEEKAKPRLSPGPLAVPLISQEAGCGKSYLLGRLWRLLDDRATLIYLRANEDRFNLWTRMLERTLQELEYPDQADAVVALPGGATQLDDLVRHILAGLITQALRSQTIHAEQPEEVIRLISADPVQIMARPDYQEWLKKNLHILSGIFVTLLGSAPVQWQTDVSAWVSVLLSYVMNPGQLFTRTACLQWIRGSVLDKDDLKLIGLSSAHNPPAEESEESRNENSFRRIRDLCHLASFYRPFLFAFDQTEIYNKSPELARDFGAQVARLQAECRNHFTVTTANETVWREGLLKNFEAADCDRFGNPIQIKGIDLEQARNLVGAKMTGARYEYSAIAAFVDQGWLQTLFKDKVTIPARVVERAASLALDSMETPEPATRRLEPEPLNLASLFEQYRLRLLRTPKATDYDAAVLEWAFKDGMSKIPDVRVDPDFHSKWGHLRVCLRKTRSKATLFVILDDNLHFRRWEAIGRDLAAASLDEQNQGRKARGVSVWHPSNRKLGDGALQRIRQTAGLTQARLTINQVSELYAGQAIYADLIQGAIPGLDEETLLQFLAGRFKPILISISKVGSDPVETQEPDPEPSAPLLSAAVRTTVKTMRSITWPILKGRIEPDFKEVTIEAVLLACQPLANEVKVWSTPSNHLFIWIEKTT